MTRFTSTIAAVTLAATVCACNSRAATNHADASATPAANHAAATDTPTAAANPVAAADPQPVGSTGSTPASAVKKLFSGTPEYREVTIPAGTVLPVDLETAVASDTSKVEEPVRARLRRAVRVDGVDVLPAGTAVTGHVTAARRPGRVKGRGYVAVRFSEIDVPNEGTTKITTRPIGQLAPATKEKDALKIIAPAAGGAVLGRVVGGKGGARTGAAVGGAAGTGYVLSTRGEEARIGKGANLSVKLTAPVTVRIPKKE